MVDLDYEKDCAEAGYDPKDTVCVDFYGDGVAHILLREDIYLTKREIKELQHCMYYAENCNHGADGHNRMNLVAKLAHALGIEFNSEFGVGIPGMYAGKITIENE